jgi:hypothetical protein
VTRIWGVSRATVYRHRHQPAAIERRRPGPLGAMADEELVLSMLTVSSPKVLDEKSPPDSEVRQSRRVQAAVALGVVPFVAGL